jgi:SAM-dependent methyltransferase
MNSSTADYDSATNQPYYEERRLKLYDLVVVEASNRLLWRCDKQRLVEHYDNHITAKHLEVGPGSGYYLDKCEFPTDNPALTLLDLNPDPLEYASQRLRRYRPRTELGDILAPLPNLAGQEYDSIGLNYVLHCLPPDKQQVFETLKSVLAPQGVLFGSTILSHDVPTTLLSRFVNRLYQRQGSFHNNEDTAEWLRTTLSRHFSQHWIEIRGSVGIFAATGPIAATN